MLRQHYNAVLVIKHAGGTALVGRYSYSTAAAAAAAETVHFLSTPAFTRPRNCDIIETGFDARLTRDVAV